MPGHRKGGRETHHVVCIGTVNFMSGWTVYNVSTSTLFFIFSLTDTFHTRLHVCHMHITFCVSSYYTTRIFCIPSPTSYTFSNRPQFYHIKSQSSVPGQQLTCMYTAVDERVPLQVKTATERVRASTPYRSRPMTGISCQLADNAECKPRQGPKVS